MPSARSSGTTKRSDRRMGFGTYPCVVMSSAIQWNSANEFQILCSPSTPGDLMRYLSRGVALATVLLLLGTSAVAAQHPQTRKGFWIGFGFGYGSYGISCDGCSGLGREGSYTGHLRMVGTINPHLLLGGEVVAWSKSEGGSTLSAGNVTLNASYYPKPAGG